MARYVAFLRGVSPLNAKMPELRRCFEAAGFSDVKTLLSSGNVAFTTRAATTAALERRIVEAMRTGLDRVFGTMVRPSTHLQAMVEADPFARFELPAAAKRVVTFLRHPPKPAIGLPPERDGARILQVNGAE